GTSVYRYYLTGTSPLFPLGKIDVTFPAGAWHDTAAASAASSGSFTVVTPQAAVAGPFNRPTIDPAVLNAPTDTGGPSYIDIPFAAAPGSSLDYASIFAGGPTLHDGGTSMDLGTPITLGTPVPISMQPDPTTGALTATPIVVHPVGGVLSAADLQTLQN